MERSLNNSAAVSQISDKKNSVTVNQSPYRTDSNAAYSYHIRGFLTENLKMGTIKTGIFPHSQYSRPE
jgi:hypothetical protein